jgi:hypothetical protein
MVSRSKDVCSLDPVDVDSSDLGVAVSPSDDVVELLVVDPVDSAPFAESSFEDSLGAPLSPPASSIVNESKADTSPESSTRTAIG